MTRLGAVLRLLRDHACLIVLAMIVLAVPAGAAARGSAPTPLPGTPVPSGFVGVDGGEPLFDQNVSLDHQLDLMVASGVQSIRVVFNWAQAQQYETPADVPSDQQGNYVLEGGVPTSFADTDKIVAAAASRGITVLPTVLYAPAWDAGQNTGGGLPPPSDPARYANYLTALIGRYGPHGTFWRSHHPRMPIRMWQIWNEPNISAYWPQPFASSYVKLLQAAHAAIKHSDRGAKVVLGALTNRAWRYLGQIYRIHGASKLFDVISVNGFTSTPTRVIEFLTLVRRAAIRLGDPTKPLLATELSWPSAVGKPVAHHDWDTTDRGQARNIAALLPMLAANRTFLRLTSFYYYAWVTQDNQPANDDFSFAGLLRYQASNGRILAKPALAAFRSAALALERCLLKGRQATRCVKRSA
jgi:hypothetical protein